MITRKINIWALFVGLLIFSVQNLSAQDKPINEMTKEEIMEMSYEELLELPFEDLYILANKFGMSADELLEYFMNKDISIASKSQENSFESPLSTSVITSEEIINSGASTIAEIFRLIPGFIVREKSPGNYDVHIRGNDNIPPNDLMLYSENVISLIMIDNRPVYSYAFGGTFWESLPIDILDIERIEVVRGPSSALYGPNAVSGVINIITKKPEFKKLQFNAHAQGGNIGGIGNADLSFGIGEDIKVRFSGNYRYLTRFTNKSYFFPYEGYYPIDSIESPNPWNYGVPIKPDATAKGYYPDPDIAQNLYGTNAFVYYDPNENISLNFSAGLQNSEVITSMVDDSYIATARRILISQYAHFKGRIHGFDARFSYNNGTQDASVGSKGLKMDFETMNANLEYNFDRIKNLNIRPGINYQQAIVDDTNYLTDQNLLNGAKKINYMAFSLRADYLLFDKLNLVAALRQDNYNVPEDSYLSFQFVASFKINNNNMVRAVYSRANNSPFIINIGTDYDWQKIAPTPNYPGLALHFQGNEQLPLPSTDMIEVGYKSRLSKHLQLELELFQSTLSDPIIFTPDSVKLMQHPQTGEIILDENMNPMPTDIYFSYNNLSVSAVQTGVTANLKAVINQNLNMRIFGTYQQTELQDYYPLTIDQTVDSMIQSIMKTGQVTHGSVPDTSITTDHEATPSFFGGFVMNYRPINRLNLNTSLYYYSKQKYIHKYGNFDIEPKLIWNMKVSYKFWKENEIFFNARNLLNNRNQEFGFLDEIGGKYFAGISLHF